MGDAKWVKIDDTVNLIGDNIEIRNCSSQYICNVLNNQDDEIAELKEQLEKVIVPRFEKNDIVYAKYTENDIFKGTVDVFDYFTQQYLIFFNESIGSDWFYDFEIFKNKTETQKKQITKLRSE